MKIDFNLLYLVILFFFENLLNLILNFKHGRFKKKKCILLSI